MHGTAVTVNVVGCTSCGLAQTNPRPDRKTISAVYPREYISWIACAPSRGQALRQGIWASFYALTLIPYALRYGVQRRVPRPPHPGAAALDVGSATGGFLRRLRDAEWDVWGVEPGVEAAQASITSLGLDRERISMMTVEEADFAPETFDLITMSHVLEHSHDPVAALQKVGRWLKPSGRLKLWCPNYASLERRIFGRYWLGLDLPRHLYHFTPRTLTSLVRAAGLLPLEIVPEPQTATLTGSVTLVFRAIRGRSGSYDHPRLLHYLLMPVGSLALAAGGGGSMAITCGRASVDRREQPIIPADPRPNRVPQ
jgi:SAM-dependent methyltransferase